MFDFSEKDSCGVGFIASRNIPPTHGMTLKVLECLANLDHRGAKFADGTGDGAGVLTEIPFELLRAELEELNIQHNSELRTEMLEKSNGMRTVPQIFINDTHVGGYNELATLSASGDLNSLLIDEQKK